MDDFLAFADIISGMSACFYIEPPGMISDVALDG